MSAREKNHDDHIRKYVSQLKTVYYVTAMIRFLVTAGLKCYSLCALSLVYFAVRCSVCVCVC